MASKDEMIMKRTAIILISIVLLSALPSCNKFLDTLPDNRTELNTKEKLLAIAKAILQDNSADSGNK